MTKKTKFITFEGIDGSGKSTFIPLIKEELEKMGEEVVLTREPGGTPLGERLREVILNDDMDVMTEALLAFASRNEHINKVIRPALEAGKFVISDRFTDSTFAYQGYAGGANMDDLAKLEQLVQKDVFPELTFLFVVPTEVSRERLSKTGKVPDKFEGQEDSYFDKANAGYLEMAEDYSHRIKVIDSSLSLEETKKQVLEHLNEYLDYLNEYLDYVKSNEKNMEYLEETKKLKM